MAFLALLCFRVAERFGWLWSALKLSGTFRSALPNASNALQGAADQFKVCSIKGLQIFVPHSRLRYAGQYEIGVKASSGARFGVPVLMKSIAGHPGERRQGASLSAVLQFECSE